MNDVLFLLIEEYGYLLLFIVLIAGIVGLPFPDEAVLLFAGGLVAKGLFPFIPVFCCSLLAVFLGSMINYQIAASCLELKFSQLGKWFRKSFVVREKSLRMVTQYGLWAIPLSYFIPGVRIGVSYTAGLFPFNPRGYVVASFIGAACWVGFYLLLGYSMVGKMEMIGWIPHLHH